MCPEGYYCDSTIQNDTYCSHGVSNPVPCPTGHYCPNGTKFAMEYPCPNGTYSDSTQLKEVTECTACPGGLYCGQEGLTMPSGDCHGGFYCTSGAWTPTPTDGVSGDICPVGAYCPVGSNQTTLCPPGTFNPTQGKAQFWLGHYQFSSA